MVLLSSACALADELVPALPAAHGAVLSRRMAAARSHLAAMRAQSEADEDPGDGTQIRFGRAQLPPLQLTNSFVQPPASPSLRPFWLISQLGASLHGEAWLTTGLRIQKAMWHQEGGMTVLSHVPEKSRLLASLCECMSMVASQAPQRGTSVQDGARTAAELIRGFEAAVAASSDGRVEQLSKIERGVRGFLSRSRNVLKRWNVQQDTSQGSYAAWTQRFALAADACSPVVSAAIASDDVATATAAHALAEQLWRGPCRFLVEDVLLLADRHMQVGRTSIGRVAVHWE